MEKEKIIEEHADKLIKLLGEPTQDADHFYIIEAKNDGQWWIEHVGVGSAEPFKQFLTGKPIK